MGGAIDNDLTLQRTLRTNQRIALQRARPTLARVAEQFREFFADWEGAYEEARLHHDRPHPKRALRVHGWVEIHETGEFLDRLWFPHRTRKTLTYKMKKAEYAKPQKKPRGIGDLGV